VLQLLKFIIIRYGTGVYVCKQDFCNNLQNNSGMDNNQSSYNNAGSTGQEFSGTPGFSGPRHHLEGENSYGSHSVEASNNGGAMQNVSNFERGLSIGVGALLVYSAIKNFRKTPFRAVLRAGLGAAMVVRGASGNCPVYTSMHVDGTKSSTVNMQTTFVVNRKRDDVYAAWRNLSQLPRFMKHLKTVTETSSTRSHWEARIPESSPVSIKWDAEIVKDEPGTMLSWRSLPGSTIDNAGKVEFRDALGHEGTEIKVTIVYRPPAGNLGTGVAKLLNPVFKRMVKEDVLNFKQYIEVLHATQPSNGVHLQGHV
jgi:uncharacterized membrane protein